MLMKKNYSRNFSKDFDKGSNTFSPFSTLNNFHSSNRICQTVTTTTSNNPMKTTSYFYNRKSIESNKSTRENINLFHRTLLHNKIKNNEKYKKLFLSNDENEKYVSIFSATTKSNFNNSNYFNNNTNYKQKKYSYNKRIINQKASLNKKFKNFSDLKLKENIITRISSNHFETLSQFNSKIKKEIKEKYINSYKKNLLNKYILTEENNIKEYQLNINLKKHSLKLYDIFNSTYEQYEKNIYFKLSEEEDKNYLLVQKENNLKKQINNLKIKIDKNRKILSEIIRNKFFFMCVKNKSKILDNFSRSDYNEIRYDQKLLFHRLYSENLNQKILFSNKNNNNINKKPLSKRNSSNFGDFHSFKKQRTSKTLEILNFDKNYVPRVNRLFVKTPEEFIQYLNSISYKISDLIHNYNIIQDEILKLKKEYVNCKKENEEYYIKYIKKFESDLEDAERNINFVKEKNNELKLIKLKSKRKTKFLIKNIKNVQIKLHEIIKSLKNEMKINKIIKESNDIECIKFIELCVNIVLEKRKILLNLYPIQYKILLNKIERIKKQKQAIINKEKYKQQFNEKIKKVLNKNEKIIIKKNKRCYSVEFKTNSNKNENNLKNNNYRIKNDMYKEFFQLLND